MSNFINKAMGLFQKVPTAPTNPQQSTEFERFDIKDLYADELDSSREVSTPGLDEKLRQAYSWITNSAIIRPFYDIEYGLEDAKQFNFGDSKVQLCL